MGRRLVHLFDPKRMLPPCPKLAGVISKRAPASTASTTNVRYVTCPACRHLILVDAARDALVALKMAEPEFKPEIAGLEAILEGEHA